MEQDPDIGTLVSLARQIAMTPEEREVLRRSFAFGNANIENVDVTRNMVEEAADRLSYANKMRQ